MKRKLLMSILVAAILLLCGCSAPTPQPTNTPEPTWTSQPTYTPYPTYTPFPSPTPIPAYTTTPTSIPTATPTPKPQPTSTPQPTPTPRPVVKVEYKDFHYECQQNKVWTRGRPPYGTAQGYRSFQVAMIVTNLGDKPIQPPWMPSRWILTDSSSQVIETYAWQWVAKGQSPYPQAPIQPGETQGWTWMAYPLQKGWWVMAIEWDYEGETYRQDLPKPNMSLKEFNYVDCEHQ